MKQTISVLLVLLFLSSAAPGEEGMWLLTQLDQLDLEAGGITIPADEIYNPNRPSLAHAVVHLGGGTAELVSPNGLILTNHHVAFGAVQRASAGKKDLDLVSSGFLAKSMEEEIEAPGYSAYILKSIEDVTPRFSEFDTIRDVKAKQDAIERRMREISDEVEEDRLDLSARVASMYNGMQYLLFVHQRFDDVRVVYVPPAAIGNYGGDIDNWMWPRHTGDFSFLRIYMAPDGSGRKYDPENVPYTSDIWLKVAPEGLKEGDTTFIIGYPGSTTRYRTSSSVRYHLMHNYPRSIKLYGNTIDLLESFAKDSTQAKMKVSGLIKGLNNVVKNYQGRIEGMKKSDFLARKVAFENELIHFLKQNPKLKKQHGHVLPAIAALYRKLESTREHDDTLEMFGFLAGQMASLANRIYYVVKEREKPADERDPQFSEKDIQRSARRLHYTYLSFYPPADRAMLKRALQAAGALAPESRIKGLDETVLKSYENMDTFLDYAYRNTRLNDPDFAKTLFFKSSHEIKALNDPFLNMAIALYPENEALRDRNESFAAAINELRKEYIQALYAWKGSELYPDANSTIRFTWGKVKGYSPRDAVRYEPFTTIKGVMEKETGDDPFIVPEKLKIMYQNRTFGQWEASALGDVPVAFLHKCDITGGNSGSPVLNHRGQLVGIAFDGNYEAMNSDWQYDPVLQRTISVDIRYVMFITEKLAGAGFLLEEMGLR